MKTKFTYSLLLLALLVGVIQVAAQGTAFTYQGRLNAGSSPANGSYDLRFALFTLTSGGSAVAGPLTNSTTAVSNGLFTVTLDFGSVFNGTSYWLEIGVRTNGTGSFITLAPRQQLTPTPYAIFAEGASNVVGVVPGGGLSGSYGSQVTFNNAGNSFSGSFNGDGSGLANINAAKLGGFGAASFWNIGGNTVSGGQFLGSANNQPVEIRANSLRVMQFAYASNAVSGYSPNVIGGNSANNVSAGVVGATIGGGGLPGFLGPNVVSADFGTVVGGSGCSAQGRNAVAGGGISAASGQASVAFGDFSIASGDYSVAMGELSMAAGTNSTVSGGNGNRIQAYANDSNIGGGEKNEIFNSSDHSYIGGGYINTIQGDVTNSASDCVIAGGDFNTIIKPNYGSTIGGGENNTNYSSLAPFDLGDGTIAGGAYNQTDRGGATVGGGFFNSAIGDVATVPGGRGNIASGDGSFAAGFFAQASNDGTFVWSDESQQASFVSTSPNQFLIRAAGGVGIGLNNPAAALHIASASGSPQFQITQNNPSDYTRLRMNVSSYPSWEMDVSPGATPQLQFWNGSEQMSLDYNGNVYATSFNPSSDRNLKENFSPVSPREVLDKVAELPITRWNFKQDKASEHLGPMAQDFKAAFGLGMDDKHIGLVDEGGVALAAIQGLNQKLEEKDVRLQEQESKLQNQATEITDLQKRLAAMERIILNQKSN